MDVRVAAIHALAAVPSSQAEELALLQFEHSTVRPAVHLAALKVLSGLQTHAETTNRIMAATVGHLEKVKEPQFQKGLLSAVGTQLRHRLHLESGTRKQGVRASSSVHAQALLAL